MEGLDSFNAYLKNLRHKAASLMSTVLSLSVMLEGEADRLRREDEASRLRALLSSSKMELDAAKRSEESARYGHTQANMIVSLGGLALGSLIRAASKNTQVSGKAGKILQNLSIGERPFGKVLINVGPEGLPDDVRVISISELARHSNRPEQEVMNELLKGGRLLFSEDEFSHLIDRLINGVLQGQMSLPVSLKTLKEMNVLSKPGLRVKQME